MTSDGEVWQKRKTLVADWDFWQIWEGQRPVADFLLEPDADIILRDHELVSRYREALEEARQALMAASMSGSTTIPVRQIVDAAFDRIAALDLPTGQATGGKNEVP